jgi:hypothetical protein
LRLTLVACWIGRWLDGGRVVLVVGRQATLTMLVAFFLGLVVGFLIAG